MVIAALVMLASVAALGTAGGAPGLAVDQQPVEYQALESEDNHVEVVFEEPIDPSEYSFTVVDADGTVVADNDDINKGLRWEHKRQVTLDLGDHDLSEGAELRVVGEGVELALPITTTDEYVQEGYDREPAIEPGATLAVVDIWGEDRYYEIKDADGTVLADGTLGEHSFVTAVDTTDWAADSSYSVKFGRESTIRTVSTIAPPDPTTGDDGEPSGEVDEPTDGDDSRTLPPHVASRTGTWFADIEPDQPGTTVKFDYGPTRGTLVIGDAGFGGSNYVNVDHWHSTPPSIESPAGPEETVSMLDVSVYGTSAETPTVTVRLPILMDRIDADAEDLVVVAYDEDDEEWVPVETSVVARSDFYGQEQVTIEGTAASPGPIAVVVDDG